VAVLIRGALFQLVHFDHRVERRPDRCSPAGSRQRRPVSRICWAALLRLNGRLVSQRFVGGDACRYRTDPAMIVVGIDLSPSPAAAWLMVPVEIAQRGCVQW